jgi:hypothetical protein
MAIQVGQVGIDFAFMPDPHGYAGIARNHAKFVCRYSDGLGGNEKRTQPGEIQDAARHGIDFLANFEFFENTREEGGASGRRHGQADRDFWNDRGLARGAGVILSWEPGNDRSKFDEVASFITHYRDAIDRPVGLYAGLPALLWMRKHDVIDFTWLPMSSAASNLDFGDISQREYAAKMLHVAQDHGLNLVQNRNRWYAKGVDEHGNTIWGADENIVVNLPAIPWSHLQAAGDVDHPAATPVSSPHHHPHGAKIWQGEPWPGHKLGFGPRDHFGNINGPAESHGGATAEERTFVQMIQQRLIVFGFVPGHSDPHDGWADGIFDNRGDGHLDGPTTDAVRRFQHKHRPGELTTRPGEVWRDDWRTLFSLR